MLGSAWSGQPKLGLAEPDQARLDLFWPGLAWPGLVWPCLGTTGLVWPGQAKPDLATLCNIWTKHVFQASKRKNKGFHS